MKKKIRQIFIFALSLVLLSLNLVMPTSATAEDRFLYPANAGDVDGNGKVTSGDARLALRIAAGIEKDVTEYMTLAADFDGNSKVTAADARKILRVSAKLEGHPYDKEVFRNVLDTYLDLMNEAKESKPGFASIFYFDMPGDKDNRRLIAPEEYLEGLEEMLQDRLEESFSDSADMTVTKEEALEEKLVVQSNSDMKNFPLIGYDVGALNFDEKYLKSASIKDAGNGNKILEITLNNEKNPGALPSDLSKPSAGVTANIFNLAFQDEDGAFAGEFESDMGFDFDFEYFDCTAYLEYNPTTKEIVSLKHEINFSLILSFSLDPEMDDSAIGFLQNMYSTFEWFDFKY